VKNVLLHNRLRQSPKEKEVLMVKLDPVIEKLHGDYCQRLPLDLLNTSESKIKSWQRNHQLSKWEFARILSRLQRQHQISQMPQLGLDIDFDNLYPILLSLHAHGHLSFQKHQYRIAGLPKPLSLPPRAYIENDFSIRPNASYNQFPCTFNSRLKRIERLLADYPYVTDLKVGLMGDDDGMALTLAQWTPFIPVVFEADPQILTTIETARVQHNLCLEIHETNLAQIEPLKTNIDTFIADPPYTLQGILAFLYHGLSCLKTFDRFYLLANQMMLGRSDKHQFLLYLTECGATLQSLQHQFNAYPLPENFREFVDLDAEIKCMGGVLPVKSLSSASSLYVFELSDLNLDRLTSRLNPEKSIYTRYGENP